jgi:hypothetical protein
MLNVPVVMVLAAAAVLAGVVAVALGRGGELSFFQADYAPLRLEKVTATDVVLFRPPLAVWGYNAQATDEALNRIADALTERDIEITALRQQVADLEAAGPAARPRGRDRLDPRGSRAGGPPPGSKARDAGPSGSAGPDTQPPVAAVRRVRDPEPSGSAVPTSLDPQPSGAGSRAPDPESWSSAVPIARDPQPSGPPGRRSRDPEPSGPPPGRRSRDPQPSGGDGRRAADPEPRGRAVPPARAPEASAGARQDPEPEAEEWSFGFGRKRAARRSDDGPDAERFGLGGPAEKPQGDPEATPSAGPGGDPPREAAEERGW